MPDPSPLPAIALVAVVVTSVATFGAGVATADSQVAVQSATIDPSTPRVGEDVTVRTTIRNFESATAAAQINQVSLRQGTRTLDTASDPGTIGAGGSIELPLSTTFDSPGRKQLTVHVYGVSADGGVFNVEYPVPMRVNERDSGVQLSLEASTDLSTEGQVNVTVANGAPTNISNLRVTLSGPNATVEDATRINASLASGRERVVRYDVTFDGPGERSLTARLDHRNSDGDRESVVATRTFAVESPRIDAELDAEVIRENDTARIDASLTNFGNVPLESVRLRAESGGETVARKLVDDVTIESTRDVSLTEATLPAGEVILRAVYEANGDSHETTTTVDFAPTTDGRIALTGIEVIPTGGSVRLAGSASNTGETPVTGAVVGVVGTERVTPVSPSKDYFVGNVPAGEFTSFELTARLAGNRTDTVPVRISYIADGQQYSRVVDVDLADAGAAGPPAVAGEPDHDGPPDDGGGFLGVGRIDVVGILLRLATVVAVGAGVLYWWRRRGDDER
jgi:hypothetical protein